MTEVEDPVEESNERPGLFSYLAGSVFVVGLLVMTVIGTPTEKAVFKDNRQRTAKGYLTLTAVQMVRMGLALWLWSRAGWVRPAIAVLLGLRFTMTSLYWLRRM